MMLTLPSLVLILYVSVLLCFTLDAGIKDSENIRLRTVKKKMAIDKYEDVLHAIPINTLLEVLTKNHQTEHLIRQLQSSCMEEITMTKIFLDYKKNSKELVIGYRYQIKA